MFAQKIKMTAFVPVAMGLYKKLDEALELLLLTNGQEINKSNKKEFVAEMLFDKSADWNLTLQGKDLLDDETKKDAMRLLVGIALRLGEEND